METPRTPAACAIRIERIEHDKRRYLPLLLVGDESERMIDRYLDRGTLYVLFRGDLPCGVCVVTDEEEGCSEIKNIAVAAPFRRQGLGRQLLTHAERCCGPRTRQLLVGTGETPSNRRFYEACGFRFTHRIPDFFRDNYDRPIVEEGITLRDMICFAKERDAVVIETERLRLRPWRETDAEMLYRYAQDPAVGPMAGWAPHRSVEESRAIIRTVFSAPEVYAAALRESDESVGAVGLHFAESVHTAEVGGREAEIGYWIGRSFWGRGLIPEAVRAVQRRAFDELGLEALWCGWYDGNDRSHRVQEKCGFRYHHIEYDKPTLLGDRRTEHFSRLTRAEWEASNNGTALAER